MVFFGLIEFFFTNFARNLSVQKAGSTRILCTSTGPWGCQLLRQGKEEPVDVQQWLLYGTHHLAAVFADADKTVALAGLQAYVQKFLCRGRSLPPLR